MRARNIGLILGIGILGMVLASCGTTEPTEELPAPQVEYTVQDTGKSVLLTWDAITGAAGYKVECDGSVIAELADSVTTYKVNGEEHVCKNITVYAVDDNGNEGASQTIDFTMKEFSLRLYRSDDPVNPSWAKIDFTNYIVDALTQGDVDPDASNTGYFIYYYDSNLDWRVFKDASETEGVGQAKVVMKFTNDTQDILAPSTGYETITENVDAGERYIFWADDVDAGLGAISENDNFGVIRVDNVNDDSLWVDITIYIQTEEYLRWVKE